MTKSQLKLVMKLNRMVRLDGWKLEYINIQGSEETGYTMFISIEKKDGWLFESHKICRYKSKQRREDLKSEIIKYLV